MHACKQPAAGSLEAAALSLAQEVSGNPDDWERRRSALFATQQAVDAAGKALPEAGGGEKAVFTPEVWRYLKEPLKHTLVRGGEGGGERHGLIYVCDMFCVCVLLCLLCIDRFTCFAFFLVLGRRRIVLP